MEAITRSIIEYINSNNTLGALQIDGPWGCGKTYYIKKVLLPIIEQNEIERENKGVHDKRLTLMISLFGIKSIDEISHQLLFASTQSRFGLSEKRIEGLKKSFSNFAKCVPYLKEIDWDRVLQIPPSACLKLLGEDTIIILDDLERLSSEINTDDVLGFVNDLVENYNFKVILVSNQGRIENTTMLFKEKVIDKTIPFEINTFSIIKSMAGKFHPLLPNFIESKNVVKYLNNTSSDQELNKSLSNLRTIRFALSQFLPFFEHFVDSVREFEDIPDIVIQKLSIIWHFTLAIAIEYRLGNITIDKINQLENAGLQFVLNNILLDGEPAEKAEKKEQTYEDRFIQRYYEPFGLTFLYIPEVYNYILRGGIIDFDKVDEIVSKDLGIWEEPMAEEMSYVCKFFGRISHLSDDEAPSQFLKFLELISKGYAEKLSDFISAANVLFSYQEVIGIDVNEIENEIIKGIDAYMIKIDVDSLNKEKHGLELFCGNIREVAKPCLQYAYRKIQTSLELQKTAYVKNLNEKFNGNMKEFGNEFMSYQITANIYSPSSSILHLMDLNMVENKLQHIKSDEIVELYNMLCYRYDDGRVSAYPEERAFLMAIKNGLDKLSDEDRTLSAHFKRIHLIPFIKKVLA